MPRNVEIKARITDVEELHKRGRELSGDNGDILLQEDTFYNSPQGRLKLRVIKGEKEELIYYERPDQDGPKCSDYIKIDGKDGDLSGDMSRLLSRCLGVKGEVKKTRTLYMVGQTRVHVDAVEGLGDFMELEVVLNDDQSIEEGERIAKDLQQKLGVKEEDLCSEAYMDMILKKSIIFRKGGDMYDDLDSYIDDDLLEIKDEPLDVNDWGDDDDDDMGDNDGCDLGSESLHVGEDSMNTPKETSNYSQGKKNNMVRDGQVVQRKKTQRKNKGKSRVTSYLLWAKEMRPSIIQGNPNMDFSAVNKRLGELWALVPTTQKYYWKRRAKRLAAKGNQRSSMISTGKAAKQQQNANLSNLIYKGRVKPQQVIRSQDKNADAVLAVGGSTPKVSVSTPKILNHFTIMPQNVEIEARITDVEELQKHGRGLSGDNGDILLPKDTFYNSPQGRLKLRVIKVVLNDDQRIKEGERIAKHLQQKLGVKEEDLYSEAYMDMILKK